MKGTHQACSLMIGNRCDSKFLSSNGIICDEVDILQLKIHQEHIHVDRQQIVMDTFGIAH